MRECRSCGSPLLKRSQKVFCSNACQASARRASGTQRWLESGEAWIDGRRNHYIRQYLSSAQSGCCAICAGPNVWLGTPLAFVVDHIDGNPSNNRRDNLRLICPNCDSQLPTYKSRNRGKGRHSRRQRYANRQSF
ncbi:HNH endonuclease [Mycolicibacterium iranicum]|uniref:HNH endonuclease n=1 Tax=Mycolicibacterium iranicum TaxID=912594 RepID=A0ABT4HE93_MYCIR|nr:HNH endonuclease [Mycolicibacterium iranicum]MCZ0728514.1 HNH endonuclease [Mycolicibacterium iranicum]